MKPLGFKNYGSIPHISTSKLETGDHYINIGQESILLNNARDKHDLIISQEKYDGSNIGIAKINGEIIALTRSGYIANTSPYRQHHIFNEWVNKNKRIFNELLNEGERICGEWMVQSHGIIYEIIVEPIVFFDLFTKTNERVLHSELKYRCDLLNLFTPRILSKGNPVKLSKLIEILNEKTQVIKSIENPEGIIFRVERKNKVDFLAKWVRNDFETGKFIKDENNLTLNLINQNKELEL